MSGSTKGFTLIEIAIALVIIGLVTGGILVGRDLIRTAQLRKLYSQEQQIVTSVNTFKVKYNCLAGDCPNATTFFGLDPEGCTLLGYDKAPKVPTCNGNGTGQLDRTPEAYKYLLLWQHLADASLWPGLFRGTYVTSNPVTNTDQIVSPPLSINDGYFWMPTDTGYMGDVPMGTVSANIIVIMSYSGTTAGFLTPAEALAFDLKYDDGNPASGSIQAQSGAWILNCTTRTLQAFPLPATATT